VGLSIKYVMLQGWVGLRCVTERDKGGDPVLCDNLLIDRQLPPIILRFLLQMVLRLVFSGMGYILICLLCCK